MRKMSKLSMKVNFWVNFPRVLGSIKVGIYWRGVGFNA